MKRASFFRTIVLSAVVVLVGFSVTPVKAGDTVDNPRYAVWAKFKPDSTSTTAADLDHQGNTVHVEITRKLVSVTADEVVIETKVKATAMGHDHDMAPSTETIPAKTDATDLKETGTADVEAMGKTFKCKTWDKKGAAPGARAKGPDDAMKNMDAVVSTSDDVPGGVVKFEGTGPDGKKVVYLLSAMEAK